MKNQILKWKTVKLFKVHLFYHWCAAIKKSEKIRHQFRSGESFKVIRGIMTFYYLSTVPLTTRTHGHQRKPTTRFTPTFILILLLWQSQHEPFSKKMKTKFHLGESCCFKLTLLIFLNQSLMFRSPTMHVFTITLLNFKKTMTITIYYTLFLNKIINRKYNNGQINWNSKM